jgi:hypothetical protein
MLELRMKWTRRVAGARRTCVSSRLGRDSSADVFSHFCLESSTDAIRTFPCAPSQFRDRRFHFVSTTRAEVRSVSASERPQTGSRERSNRKTIQDTFSRFNPSPTSAAKKATGLVSGSLWQSGTSLIPNSVNFLEARPLLPCYSRLESSSRFSGPRISSAPARPIRIGGQAGALRDSDMNSDFEQATPNRLR